MARIRVKNLLIRTNIGFNPEELANKQDVIINVEIKNQPDFTNGVVKIETNLNRLELKQLLRAYSEISLGI
ncbi:MAG: hypothetical protein J7L95_03150 [Prolixibacteraceae bacterium]|nr:hypothetical protein [Prolixibacteraceae bacterium]